jgi:TolB protein
MKPAHLTPIAALGAALLATGCSGESASKTAPVAHKAQAELPGGRIAFRRYLNDAQTLGAVFTVKPDGTGEQQITHPTGNVVDDQPDWSPDGRTIAFERCPQDAPCSVWTVSADGGEPAKVRVRCRLKPICDARGPAYLGDGRMIVGLAQGREKSRGDLLQIERFSVELLDLKRDTQRTVVARDHWTGDTAEPTISSDGRTVVYKRWNSWKTKPVNGTSLYAIRTDGSHHRQLTPWKLEAGDHPVFSPDRRTVLFRSFAEDDSKQADYYTVDVKTRRITRLSHFEQGTTVLSGSYSADGKWIAHATDGVGGQADVFAMRADGSENQPVTRTKAWDSAPDWGPPGS